jgi:hypothetical protein
MIHVVFNESETELMKQVVEMDESLEGDVVLIRDDFAVGPLKDLDTEEGWQSRISWWTMQLEGSPYTHVIGTFDDRETMKELASRLEADETEQVWIWMGQNQHDVMGYYWLMPQLAAFQGRVHVVYLNNLPFINEKGQLFYPSWLNEIQPKEFLKAKKLARPITASEFEIDPDEWRKLAEESAAVRILEGGKKIAGKEENFYDNEILKNLSPEWQKATRVLSNTLHRMKIKTGDAFLMKRMKELISQGKIEVSGNLSGSWKDFDVKLAGARSEEAQSTIEEKTN